MFMAETGRDAELPTSYHPPPCPTEFAENSSLIKSPPRRFDTHMGATLGERMSTATAIDPQQLVQQAIKKITAIATLPEVTSKIIEIVEDPKSTAAELHKIDSHDPALVTRILKVVNSAFYGLPGQIGSIERGIVLLGLNAVKNIAVAASLGQLFRGMKLCEEFSAKDLWTHCIGVGIVARS